MIEVLSYDKALKKRVLDKNISKDKSSKSWIILTEPSRDEIKEIQQIFKLHKTTTDDIIQSKKRAKIEQFEDYTLIISHNIAPEDSKVQEIDIILGKNYIITSTKTRLESIEQIKKDKELLSSILKQGPEFVLHAILNKSTENYFPLIEKIDKELDEIENRALKNPEPATLESLFSIKRQLLRLRRTIYPQREIITSLNSGTSQLISKDARTYFRDVYDHLIMIADIIEYQRDTISSILEVHLSVTSNKLNEIMKVLTVFATVLMPLTLIASIYGMNFKFMPELEWRYGYFIVLGGMLLVLIGTIIFLKRKKWI